MRAIRFRAWDDEIKMMFEIGSYIDLVLAAQESDEHWLTCTDHVLMQYTGLKDKTGVEIYEGDIWRRDTFIGIVEFKYSQWALSMAESSGCYQHPAFCSNSSTGEVIGNIYQNPELLES